MTATTASGTRGEDYGIYQVFLDGKNIADFDDKEELRTIGLYSSALSVRDSYVGSLLLSRGKHALRLQYVGKNPFFKGRLLGLDSVRLRARWQKKRPSLKAD